MVDISQLMENSSAGPITLDGDAAVAVRGGAAALDVIDKGGTRGDGLTDGEIAVGDPAQPTYQWPPEFRHE